jgi:predicted acetyltransferase
MEFEVRSIRDDEIGAFRETLMQSFGFDAEMDVGGVEQHRALVAPGRSWAAFDQGALVGTAATFDLQLSLPGGTALDVAGLTMVSVRPTHRRRGILRQLMSAHLDDARARNQPASGLWASEAPIYQRFGYGLAAYCDVYEIPNANQLTVSPRDLDELIPVDEAKARDALPAIYARATAARPGALRRSPMWWQERRFLETPWVRAGASKRRHVLAKRGDELVGYLVYRQRAKFTDGMPDGRLEITELIAVDARAEASLWSFAIRVDLFPAVSWWNAPADDALPWLVDDMRRIKRRRGDNLWLRIEDIPAALTARGYDIDGMLRVAVDGTTYELSASGGRAECKPTTKNADIAMSGRVLASMYLGCASASELARADAVSGEAAAILTADRLFASRLAPWCPEVF